MFNAVGKRLRAEECEGGVAGHQGGLQGSPPICVSESSHVSRSKKLEETLRDAWREQGRLERERDDAQERDDELGDLKEELTKANDDRATIRSLLSGMGINDIELLEGPFWSCVCLFFLTVCVFSHARDRSPPHAPHVPRRRLPRAGGPAQRAQEEQAAVLVRQARRSRPQDLGAQGRVLHRAHCKPGHLRLLGISLFLSHFFSLCLQGKGSCEFHNILVSTQRLPESTQERDWLFTFLKLAFPNKVYTEAVGPTRAE